jgi:plastocyanin
MRRRSLLLIGLLGVLVVALAAAVWAGWLAPRHALRLQAAPTADGGYAFDPVELRAPADRPVSLVFDNTSDAPHTLVLLPPIDVSGQIRYPGESDRLEFTTPTAGSYRFVCNVHADMGGRLIVDDAR